jgi:hypothetical protein
VIAAQRMSGGAWLALQTLWLALPVICGGLLHVAAMKLGVFSPLARVPIDGGLTFRGRRVLGDNKTLRGALFIIAATAACAAAQRSLELHAGWARDLSLIVHDVPNAAAWGALLGTGYLLGELPNSFLKRQLDIAPGGAGGGWLGPLFWVMDQVDSLAGVLIVMPILWTPPIAVVLMLVGVTLTVHPAVALIMVMLGLKQRVG